MRKRFELEELFQSLEDAVCDDDLGDDCDDRERNARREFEFERGVRLGWWDLDGVLIDAETEDEY